MQSTFEIGQGGKRLIGKAGAYAVALMLASASFAPHVAQAQSQTQTTTTPAVADSFVIPDGVEQITITAQGGSGGNRTSAPGGGGATVVGTFAVSPGDTIYFIVGEKGESGSANDAGGGGSTGVFINSTLVMVAGGGGGADNTGGVAVGGASSLAGLGSGGGSGCTAIPGGTGGNGGPGGGLIPAGCNNGINGGSGGGGILSPGQVGGGLAGGGGAADLNPLDGLTVAQGGAAGRPDASPGRRGGAGFTGGGGSQDRESGGGGGYSGGAGGNPSSKPGGGGSFLDSSALSGTITAGPDATDTGNGLVTFDYELPGLVTKKTLLSSDATPPVGSTVSFLITVSVETETGGFFSNISLTDALPAGLTPTANHGTVSQGSYAAGTGFWDIGFLGANDTATLLVEGVVNNDQYGNTITNTTTAATSSTQPDNSTVGDDLTETVVVTTVVDLSLTKTNTPGVNGEVDQADDAVTSGETTTYTTTITNNGPDPAIGAIVTDAPGAGITCDGSAPVTITGDGVPAGSFTFSDLSGAGIALGTLSNGQTTTLTYSCQVN
uniref:hypothetical protein n=1 Tax=uncultured Erythrobacter sp. TaxID=263913 RepID=UPI00260BA273|nr:hypothetical protein [uncultured Erythrobacter sp.]